MKKIGIITASVIIISCGLYAYQYKVNKDFNNSQFVVTNIPQINNKLGDNWVEGNYKYVVEKRSGLFYFVSATNNTPKCLDTTNVVYDPVACAGGGYYAKDGETWKQSLAESLDCANIRALVFPENFDNNISSCY